MGRKDDYENHLTNLLYDDFDVRHGRTVPTTESVSIKNGGVYLDAVYLYADMADSSGMARRFTYQDAARIVRCYLATVTRILRHHDGYIRSFDGDRVMAIFIGDDAASRAAKAAMEIKWAVDNLVNSSLAIFLDAYRQGNWVISHRTGIDIGGAFIVRGGVRKNSDLVSIGDAPNIAAKLSDLRGSRTFITDALWDKMSYATCFSNKDSKAMWTEPTLTEVGGRKIQVRSSNWGWVIN
ncbi:adenylate/guanylate cyclase domain-containing protein [Ornithinimicrobium panacihumi]|uniref:adenylate/guanylate cyclase domain-containing protein n=1 Tax=Ornithinimicrobium panacihumi TaxID=2008449 RepID=UPI003F8A1010